MHAQACLIYADTTRKLHPINTSKYREGSYSERAVDPHLEVVENGDLEVGLLALGYLPLPVHIPGGSHNCPKIGPALQDFIVHRHGAAPAAQPSRLGVLQTQKRCSNK